MESKFKGKNDPDILLPSEIYRNLNTKFIGQEIYSFHEVISTNTIAKQELIHNKEKIAEGTVIIAEKQNGGKGRLGRKWFSPPGGVWLSIILYPNPSLSPSYMPRLTLMTAVVAARVIQKSFQIKVEIKWPNDILLDGKKICGILTQMGNYPDRTYWVITGIGINANVDISHFPKDIQENSTSLKQIIGKEVSRVKLIGNFLDEFEKYYTLFQTKKFAGILDEWKKLSHMIGKTITVGLKDGTIIGEVIDMSEKGGLVLKKQDGKSVEIISGTILTQKGRRGGF